MKNAIGIVDEANAGGNKDNLGIQTHTNSPVSSVISVSPVAVPLAQECESSSASSQYSLAVS